MLFDNNSGTYSIDGDYNFNNNGCCVTGALSINVNGGTFSKASGTGNSSLGANTALNVGGTGLLSVVSGTLQLTGGGTANGGSISISGGALLDLNGGPYTINAEIGRASCRERV